jgi:CheY-like chemotaxis protein
LGGQGYRLACAAGGAEAIERALAEQPDLVLLDVMMPEVDGFEVCRRLRADPALAEVPIVMGTALDDPGSRLQGIEAGADDFISKPYNRTELRARVRSITRLNRYRRLVDQRSTFEWLVDRADDGYLIVDAAGAIGYANVVARRYLGAPADGPIDTTFTDLAQRQYHNTSPDGWDDWIVQASAVPEPRLLIRPASDSADVCTLQAEVRALFTGADGRYLVQMRDITATVIEQQSVWSFQSLIRHKLFTTLSQLNGALRLIEYLQLTPADASSRDLFAIALNGASGLKDNIENIFHYLDSKNIAEPVRGRFCLADLPSLIAEVRERQSSPPIEVRLADIEDPQALTLGISREALELIVAELFENARKFHPTQTPAIEVVATRASGAVSIDVRDDGRSLSPDQLARAWQPYFQGERYFTGQTPGMGLGLPVVATLMWRVGGACRLYNREPAPGVCVGLTIPTVSPNGVRP